MRIAKDFLREAIQLVATKRPPIAFKIEEGAVDRNLGEKRMYELHTQLKEDNVPVYSLAVEVLKGQSMGNMDTMYNLTMFEEQTVDNLEQCLNAVTVQVFPNKPYKLQKWYIWHIIHKPRYIPVHKWVSRVVKLNNYLTEFPMHTGVEAKKLEQEELLEVLENRIPITWRFKMDKEGFGVSSSTLKDFTKTYIHYKECKLKVTEKTNTAHKSHSERGGKRKAKRKASKKAYHNWGQDSP
eukprot:4884931-Ditylum_brightwellii.AAC.1